MASNGTKRKSKQSMIDNMLQIKEKQNNQFPFPNELITIMLEYQGMCELM